MSIPFDPDWVVPTSEMLRDWLEQNRLSTSVAAVAGSLGRGTPSHAKATTTLNSVLKGNRVRRPEATVLSTVTGISAEFWLAFEHNYRTGLAAGKTVTGR